MRGFEPVSEESLRVHNNQWEVVLPRRATFGSAGYDLFVPEYYKEKYRNHIWLTPGERFFFYTDVKCYMEEDEALFVYIRSGLSIKTGLTLTNAVGIVDSDYYSNASNDGNIGVSVINPTPDSVELPLIDKHGKMQRIAQGVFGKYLKVNGDNTKEERGGGYGWTG